MLNQRSGSQRVTAERLTILRVVSVSVEVDDDDDGPSFDRGTSGLRLWLWSSAKIWFFKIKKFASKKRKNV